MSTLNLPKGYLPVVMATQCHILMGGPYRNKPSNFKGVKMAAEINEPCAIDIPTQDFNVPDEIVFRRGLVAGFVRMLRGQHVYVGCMGGIGRTGLYMAGIAKVLHRNHWIEEAPIDYVRKYYIPNAVETTEQIRFITELEVEDIAYWLMCKADPGWKERAVESMRELTAKKGE